MKRILVVDDIAENRYLLEAMLQAYGYEVSTANDGVEALANAHRQPPDLIISDILMPMLDGFALCKQWRAERALRGIPFIFYTATYTDARDEQLAMDLGADRFVIKPQEPQVMHAIVQDVLARGAKCPVVVASPPQADESVTLREYNEALVRKLEKKVTELEATREALEADNRQRLRVEEALRRSEDRWRLIYETEPECVKVVSAECLLRDMNPAGLAMIDATSLDEVRGKSLLDLIAPEHHEAYLAMHRDVLGGQPRRLVFEAIGLNGTRRWLETHEVPLPNADGTLALLGITRDITQRKESEERLRRSQRHLEALVDSVDGIVWEADAESLRFTFVSPRAERLLGYPLSRWIEEPTFWMDHIHPDDREEALLYCGVATREKRDHELEYRMLDSDGREVWLRDIVTVVVENDRPVTLRGIMVDITERRRAEAALVESEQRFRDLYESSRDAIFVEDVAGQVRDVNPAACRLHGLTREQLLSKNVRDLVPEEQREDLDRNFSKLFSGELTLIEGSSLRADGTTVPVEISASRIVYNGQPSLLSHVRDITERKRAETALREREQQLRLFVEHSPAAIAMMDRDLRYLVASQCWLSDYRLGAESVIGRCHYDLFPEIPERWKEIHRRCLAGAIEKCDEEAILREDGTTDWLRWEVRPWYTVQGEVGGLIMFSEVITERKQAETALRASEQRFATVFRASPVGICVTRLADGTFLDMNDAFSRIIGHTREEMIGRSSLVLNYWVDPEDRAKIVHALQANGSVRNWEMRFVRRDGSVRDSLRSLERITLDGEDCILTILEDITERKHIEAALRDSEASLVAAQERAKLGNWELDLPTQTGWCSPGLFHLFDLDMAQGTPTFAEFMELVHPDDRQSMLESQVRLAESGQDSSGDLRFRFVNGEVRHFFQTVHCEQNSQGQTVRLTGTLQDITERKLIEDALRESQTMLELVLDSIPQGVFWKDRDSVYLGANRVVRQALGFDTPESIIGRTDFEIASLTRDQAEFYVSTDRDIIESDQPQFGIKETMTLIDGSTIWLETNKMPMHAPSGQVIGILGTWQDITVRKQAEVELRASRERLQILSRQLLNAQEAERRHIARELHDQIGQSLTAIKLNLKMLQPSAHETSALTILHETITVVDQTLEQVRTLSLDLRPSMLDDLGLVAALRWYLDRQAQRAGFSVQFASEFSDGDVSKEIETTCFRVVQELVTNIARHAQARNVRVELRQLETELELFIQDDGVGFDLTAAREQAPHETSLGLLGMQERVMIVGGRLEIQSAPSRGTEVRVRFPLMPT